MSLIRQLLIQGAQNLVYSLAQARSISSCKWSEMVPVGGQEREWGEDKLSRESKGKKERERLKKKECEIKGGRERLEKEGRMGGTVVEEEKKETIFYLHILGKRTKLHCRRLEHQSLM